MTRDEEKSDLVVCTCLRIGDALDPRPWDHPTQLPLAGVRQDVPHAMQCSSGTPEQPAHLPDGRMPPPLLPHANAHGEQYTAYTSGFGTAAHDRYLAAPEATQVAQVHASVRFPTADRSTWKARPIAQFSFYGAISVALVSQYELPQQTSDGSQFSMCASAVVEYQHAMCAPHKLLPHEVCWFQNYPHTLAS